MGLNFLVDFLLLLASDRMAGHPAAPGRKALAAGLGAVYSGACLLPGFLFLAGWVWRGVFLGLMAGTAFGWSVSGLRRGLVFLVLSMSLGGAALGAGLIPAAAGLWLACRFGLRGLGQQRFVPVTLRYRGRELKQLALQDTGNSLWDPLTGEQVLVAGAGAARTLLDLTPEQLTDPVQTLADAGVPGLRLVPYRAVGQPGGMLLALRLPGSMIGKRRTDPLVAFAPQELGGGEGYQMLTGGAV